MCHKKRKLTKISGTKRSTDSPTKCWVEDFIMLQIFTEDSLVTRKYKN